MIEEYERMIDGTSFGVIKSYIMNPNSEVNDILYCNSQKELPRLALELTQCADIASVYEVIQNNNASVIKDENMRHSIYSSEFLSTINVLSIDFIPDHQGVLCIYLPPFYLISMR